jgi:predicted nucleic acid-binding protein
MIVASNTSPLTNLAAISQFELLQALFSEIHIAVGVVDELSFGGIKYPGAAEVESANWTVIHRVKDQSLVDALRLDLDRGESETIALGLQLDADLILMDEQDGRRAAQFLNLAVMGTVGLLIRGKRLGIISEVQFYLDALRQQAGFYLSDTVYDHALRLAQE